MHRILLILSVAGLLAACSETNNSIEPVIQVTATQVTEDVSSGKATVSIQITNQASGDFQYDYQIIEGTAKAGDDYIADDGQVTVSSASQGVIDITIVNDEFMELNEEFKVRISRTDGTGSMVEASVEIANDDFEYTPEKVEDGFITPDSYPSMTLVWSDEFNDTSVDTDNWSYEIGDGCDKDLCGWGNNEMQDYSDSEENVFIQNQKLVIKAVETGVQTFSSGRLYSEGKQQFKFGRIDIRAKMPLGQGLWPALWMLGSNIGQVGWPKCGEIDIMEYKGQFPDVVHGTVHYDNNGYKYTGTTTSLTEGNKFSDEFHVFTLLWDRNTVTWLVDYEPYSTITSSSLGGNYPFNEEFYFVLNVAVGGNFVGAPDETTVFPQQMEVDYIRVFQ